MKKTDYKTVGIVAKPHADHLSKVVSQLYDLLQRYNCRVVIDDQSSHLLGDKAEAASRGELVRRSDVVLVLGGDGTMLSLAKYQDDVERPVVGINMGSLGFLTEIAVTEAVEMTEAALRGKLEISYRMMLCAELIREGAVEPLQHVLNDIVINKSAVQQRASNGLE